MGDVIVDVDERKRWRYAFWYYLIWIMAVSGALIAIGSAINTILSCPLLSLYILLYFSYSKYKLWNSAELKSILYPPQEH